MTIRRGACNDFDDERTMSGHTFHRFLFYSHEISISSETVSISGEEHHHLSRVLRASRGEVVYVGNGRGLILRCRVETVDRARACARVVGVEKNETRVRPVTLALALLRKDAFERAVEQCTELGVTACLPFVSGRSHLKGYSAAFVDRLHRLSASAAKQSFRSTIPAIEKAVAFEELLARAASACTLLADDEGSAPSGISDTDPLILVVGAEGGLAESEEKALAHAGARKIRVSRQRLRSETAAAALVSIALAPELGRGE